MAWLAGLMPWVLSAMFHVGLGLVMLFIVMVVISTPEKIPVRPLTNPEMPITDSVMIPMEQQKVDTDRVAKEEMAPRPRRGEVDSQRTMEQMPDVPDVLGHGAPSQTFGKHGDGLRFFDTKIELPDGPETPDGPPIPGGQASVVYVLDRSGSMMNTFDALRWELGRSIGQLNQGCGFHVLFFADGRPLENAPRRLVPATRAHRSEAIEWIAEVMPEGQTDPVAALERAFAVLKAAPDDQPKYIHLLTDGVFPDNEKVLSTIRRLNADRRVRIYTFMYGSRPAEAVDVLQRIARETAGRYDHVRLDE
jgi:hypothetical protein